MKHIKKVNADIGGNASGFFDIAFPGLQIPSASGCDVGQINFVLLRNIFGGDLSLVR